MIYRARAVLPGQDRAVATARLRDQLRIMALAGGVVVDWSTLSVDGPLEPVGMTGGGWSGWVASASVETAVPVQGVGAAGIEPATARL